MPLLPWMHSRRDVGLPVGRRNIQKYSSMVVFKSIVEYTPQRHSDDLAALFLALRYSTHASAIPFEHSSSDLVQVNLMPYMNRAAYTVPHKAGYLIFLD